jgi:hypothetical protein
MTIEGHQIAIFVGDQSPFASCVKGCPQAVLAAGICVVFGIVPKEAVTSVAAGFKAGVVPSPACALTRADAVDIWIARWLRTRPIDLVRRYRCDPRRLYEIWEERRFPGSRSDAMALFRVRYPTLEGRCDYGAHRRISRETDPAQLSFFELPG